jgi:hypothetical protein
MLFGIAADAVEIAGQTDDDTFGELALSGALAIAKNATSKTWLKGAADALEALDDPDRYGKEWLKKQAGSLVPAGIAQIEKSVDPGLSSTYAREGAHMEILNAIQARIPGWSKELPPRRNLWGQAIVPEGSLGPDWLSPVYTSTEKSSPVDEEIVRMKIRIRMPSETQKIHGEEIKLTAKEYDDLIVKMNALRLPGTGKTLKRSLDEMVRSPDYKRLSDERKETRIRNLIEHAKEYTREEIYRTNPQIRTVVDQLALRRMEAQQ